MTYPMLYTDNANSWKRMWMLWRFYSPLLLPGLIWYAIASFAIVLITGLIFYLSGNFPTVILSWTFSLMIYCSPLMLTRRDSRFISAQLPVTAAEKLGFLLIVFCLVVPLDLVVFGTLSELLSTLLFGETQLTVRDLFANTPSSINVVTLICLGYISSLCTIAITLYYNVTSRRSRVLATLVAPIAVNFALGVIGGIIGGIMGAMIALRDIDVQSLPSFLDEWFPVIYGIPETIIFIAAVIYSRKLYKYLQNSGF